MQIGVIEKVLQLVGADLHVYPNALCLHQLIPLLWRGGRRMHFVMHAFNNHVKVLHDVTPFVAVATNGGSI